MGSPFGTSTSPPRVVGDIMTRKVITVEPGASLRAIEDGMNRFRFRHLPVVDGDGKLVGLVTHRDILLASSSLFSKARAERNEIIQSRFTVEDLMRVTVKTTHKDQPLAEAGRLIWDYKIGCLPVVEEDGKLIGIVTNGDFVKLAVELLDGGRMLSLDEAEAEAAQTAPA